MTPIDAPLSHQIEQDITGTLEKGLEDATKQALDNLQKKGLLSDGELTDLYEANFQNIVSGSVDDANILVEKVQKLKSTENKLLATYMAQAKEEADKPGWAKRLIYKTIGIDTDISKNGTGKNIAKGVIDELLSIPEMVGEILKSPVQFAKGLYESLVKNFSQTMKAIKESYADILGGVDTPESAYKSGRSGVLIILTFFPGALGKTLLSLGRNTAKLASKSAQLAGKGVQKVGEYAGKAVRGVAPKSAEWVGKQAPKVGPKVKNVAQGGVDALNKVKSKFGAELGNLKKGIEQSRVGKAAAKGAEISKNGMLKMGQGINYMKNLPLVNDILNLPIRFASGTVKVLGKIIPNNLQPTIVNSIGKIVTIRRQIPKIDSLLKKYPTNPRISNLASKKASDLVIAQDLLKTHLTVLGVVGLSEVDDVYKQMLDQQFLDQLAQYLQEDNEQDILLDASTSAVGLETGSTDISPDALDYPQLEGFDRSVVDWTQANPPRITIVGLASKTGSLEINDRISTQRAEKARAILAEKYNIPEEAFVLENAIQPADDEDEVTNRQGVHVSIDNFKVSDDTYIASYDAVRDRYGNPSMSPNSVDTLDDDRTQLADGREYKKVPHQPGLKEHIALRHGSDVVRINTYSLALLKDHFNVLKDVLIVDGSENTLSVKMGDSVALDFDSYCRLRLKTPSSSVLTADNLQKFHDAYMSLLEVNPGLATAHDGSPAIMTDIFYRNSDNKPVLRKKYSKYGTSTGTRALTYPDDVVLLADVGSAQVLTYQA